jgi:hypothetical protein
MLYRIIFCLGVPLLAACSTAKMTFDPDLDLDSEKYLITERPVAFSGGDLVFGPYRASRINRSFVSKTAVSAMGFSSKKVEQDYNYHFKGLGGWEARCVVESGNMEYRIISGGYFADIHCGFVPVDNGNSAAAEWYFDIGGETSGTARGEIRQGSKVIEVAAVNKTEASSQRLSQHTGYHFYSHDKLVAAVDTISQEGPVWVNRQLTVDEKDVIGLVVVALLLNQV